MIKQVKDTLYISREWLRRMYEYPQSIIIPGSHFDYDAYWKEKRGNEYIGALGRWQAKRAFHTAKVIGNGEAVSINDIGSGAGEVLLSIKKQASVGEAIVYDSSAYALEIAKEQGLKTVMLDITKKEDYAQIVEADYTLMFEILEHIPGPEELLAHAYKQSRKAVLFSFPNTGFFIHRFRLFFFGKAPMQWTKHPGEHLRFWTKKDLEWWLNAQGYRNYHVNYYVGIPVLKTLWPNMFAAGFFVTVSKVSSRGQKQGSRQIVSIQDEPQALPKFHKNTPQERSE